MSAPGCCNVPSMEDSDFDNPAPQPPGRWQLVRDVIVFQFKLALDGLRDLLLSPVSMVLGLVGILSDPHDPGKYFRRLMSFGRETDRWINLFNAHDDEETNVSVDDVVRRAEDMLRAEHDKGGVVKTLKEGTDGVIDRFNRSRDKEPGAGGS